MDFLTRHLLVEYKYDQDDATGGLYNCVFLSLFIWGGIYLAVT